MPLTRRFRAIAILVSSLAWSGCASTLDPLTERITGRLPALDADGEVRLSRQLANAIAQEQIVTAGIGLIRNGRLAWTAYYGDERPGVPANGDTRFNVASITKTITAETVLRLVDKGASLDDPMAPHWIDPDLVDDPRHRQLTPRHALTHTTGLPNWRFLGADGKLRFDRDPGSYGYSGEGFEYLARYVEAVTGLTFPAVVDREVFQPLGIVAARLVVDRTEPPRLARPVDDEGEFPGWYCRPGGWCREDGSFSAADDLVISVPEYARFLVALMDHSGYGAELADERDRVQAERGDERAVQCTPGEPAPCPLRQGYGLGLEVIDYGDMRVAGHGGSDWSEMSLAYFYLPSRDGVIVFLNAPNRRALEGMANVLALLDPRSPFLSRQRAWLDDARRNPEE
jgi:CubicO group peptidase (beta-lactamase class C family)